MVDVKLDDRIAFEAWVQTGSLDKASKFLESHGLYNPNTGLAFHPGSVRQAANRFILNNVKEAREVYNKLGSIMNEDQWNVRLLLAACKVFSRKNFILWVRQNPWSLKYPRFIDRRFPGLSDVLIFDAELSKPVPETEWSTSDATT
jgi:hypothetical protein